MGHVVVWFDLRNSQVSRKYEQKRIFRKKVELQLSKASSEAVFIVNRKSYLRFIISVNINFTNFKWYACKMDSKKYTSNQVTLNTGISDVVHILSSYLSFLPIYNRDQGRLYRKYSVDFDFYSVFCCSSG